LRFETIAFKAKLAGMGEDGRAVTFHMFLEPDAGAGRSPDWLKMKNAAAPGGEARRPKGIEDDS
jgi:hypothetical protein